MNEELKIIIAAEIAKLKSGMENAKKQVTSFKDQVEKASADVDSKFKNMGSSMANGAKAFGTAVVGVGSALVALGVSTSEYRESQSRLATAFETAGGSAEDAKNTYNDLYRVLGDGDRASEAAGHLAKLTTNEKELSEWTTICEGVWATYGESLPIEGLTEAANETAKVGTVTGTLADALNWAGVSEDAFNEKLAACNTEAEREKLIRETLSGLYDEAAAKYEENNAQVLAQNEAQAKLQDTMAKLGAAIAPVITAFTNFANEALAAVTPHIQQIAETYGPKLQEVLGKMAEVVGKVVSAIVDNWGIITGIAAVIGGIATAIGLYNAVAAIKAAMAVAEVTTVWGLVAAYAAQAAAMLVAIAPYALIVAAIAAVIAIIVVCVKHWDEIKAKVQEVWENIKAKTTEAVEKVKAKFTEMKENAQAKIEEMKSKISEKIEAIKSTVSEKFNAIKNVMSNTMQAAKDTVNEKLTNMKNAYNQHGGGIKGIASAAMEGIKGYYTAGYTFIDKLTGGKLSEIANTMKSKMDSAKESVSNVLNAIKDKFSSILNNAKTIVTNAIEGIKKVFKFEWSLPKLKLPRISVSGSFSLSPLSVPKFSITWNKLGGVFDKPTLFNYDGTIQGLGEDGAEAVVPLERNTQWLDRLATMLNDKMGVGQPIILQVDGKTFAQISVDSINQLTRQRGSLPLNLV